MVHYLQKTVGKLNSDRVKRLKKALFTNCGSICYLCDTQLDMDTSTIDHLIPKSLGGTNYIDNLALACYDCNHDKKSDLDSEHFIYICNRLRTIPQSVEEFFEVLHKHNVITDRPYNFNKLSSKMITFFRTIKIEDLQLVEVCGGTPAVIPQTNPQPSGKKRKRTGVAPAVREQFLRIAKSDPDFLNQCYVCSETKDVGPVKIISNTYGGADHSANLAVMCPSCVVGYQNSFEKWRINYIIKRDFKDEKEWYPTTVEQIYGHLYHSCVLKESIDSYQTNNLIAVLTEMFNP